MSGAKGVNLREANVRSTEDPGVMADDVPTGRLAKASDVEFTIPNAGLRRDRQAAAVGRCVGDSGKPGCLVEHGLLAAGDGKALRLIGKDGGQAAEQISRAGFQPVRISVGAAGGVGIEAHIGATREIARLAICGGDKAQIRLAQLRLALQEIREEPGGVSSGADAVDGGEVIAAAARNEQDLRPRRDKQVEVAVQSAVATEDESDIGGSEGVPYRAFLRSIEHLEIRKLFLKEGEVVRAGTWAKDGKHVHLECVLAEAM